MTTTSRRKHQCTDGTKPHAIPLKRSLRKEPLGNRGTALHEEVEHRAF